MRIELSDEQREAVEVEAPRVVVSAGAGAGKTRVLTARFLRRLEQGLDLDSVVAVTFTEKAAGELKRRIRDALVAEGDRSTARRVSDAWVSTIHGLCRRIVREHGLEVGIDPDSRVLAEHEALILAAQAMEAAMASCAADGDADVQVLLEVWDVAKVARAVRGIHDRVAAAGLDPRRVEPHEPPAPREIGRCAERLRSLSEQMQGLKRTETRDSNIAVVLCAAEIMEVVAEDMPLEDPTRLIDALDALERCRITARGSEELKTVARDAKGVLVEAKALIAQMVCTPYERGLAKLVARFAERYTDLKREASAVDFEDLQTQAARLLSERPDVAREYRERFVEVMVDEFQDTNRLQSRIVSALPGRSLVAVGDKRQSIYGFRFAEVQVFEELAKAGVVKTLSENRRSHPDVLEVVNHVFEAPTLFGCEHDRLRAARRKGRLEWPAHEPRVRVLLAVGEGDRIRETRRAEAALVAEEVARLCGSGIVKPCDVAILSRQLTGRARVFEEALRQRGIESVSTSGDFFSTQEAQDGVMLLRVIDNVYDDEAWVHVLAGDLGRVSAGGLHRLRAASGGDGLWSAIQTAGSILQGTNLERVCAVRGAVESARARRGALSPGDVLVHALSAMGHDVRLAQHGAAGIRAWQNLLLLARLADESDGLSGRGIRGFLADEKDLAALGVPQAPVPDGVEAVRIMTIHGAKGLEFPVVFVVGMTEQERSDSPDVLVDCSGEVPRIASRMPAELPIGGEAFSRSSERPKPRAYAVLEEAGQEERGEEEKRLLYVAFTRAEEALYLVGALPARPGGARQAALDALGVDIDAGCVQDAVRAGDVVVPVVRRVTGTEAGSEEPSRPGAEAASEASVVEGPTSEPDGEPASRPVRVPLSSGPIRGEHQAGSPEGRTQGAPSRVSPSALEDFERCPYRYYVSHVLGLADPAHDRGATEFGTIVHEALRHVVMGIWGDDRLAAVSRRHGMSDTDRARLAEVVDSFDRSDLAAALRAHEQARAEVPFALMFGETILSGRMDVYARSGEEVLVVDFKWHKKPPSNPRQDDAERYSRQMVCYALAGFAAGARSVQALVYDVASGNVTGGWSFEAHHAALLETEVHDLIGRISRGGFRPLGSYQHDVCVGCPGLSGLCSVRPPRRAV